MSGRLESGARAGAAAAAEGDCAAGRAVVAESGWASPAGRGGAAGCAVRLGSGGAALTLGPPGWLRGASRLSAGRLREAGRLGRAGRGGRRRQPGRRLVRPARPRGAAQPVRPAGLPALRLPGRGISGRGLSGRWRRGGRRGDGRDHRGQPARGGGQGGRSGRRRGPLLAPARRSSTARGRGPDIVGRGDGGDRLSGQVGAGPEPEWLVSPGRRTGGPGPGGGRLPLPGWSLRRRCLSCRCLSCCGLSR